MSLNCQCLDIIGMNSESQIGHHHTHWYETGKPITVTFTGVPHPTSKSLPAAMRHYLLYFALNTFIILRILLIELMLHNVYIMLLAFL